MRSTLQNVPKRPHGTAKRPHGAPPGAVPNVPKRLRWGAAVAVQNEIITPGATFATLARVLLLRPPVPNRRVASMSNGRLNPTPACARAEERKCACACMPRRAWLDTLHPARKAPSAPLTAFPTAFRLLTYTGARNGVAGALCKVKPGAGRETTGPIPLDPVVARLDGRHDTPERGQLRL